MRFDFFFYEKHSTNLPGLHVMGPRVATPLPDIAKALSPSQTELCLHVHVTQGYTFYSSQPIKPFPFSEYYVPMNS